MLILAKQGSLQLANNSIEKPFLESEQDVSSTRTHHSQGHLSEGYCNTLVVLDTKEKDSEMSGREMAKAGDKMQTARLGRGSSEEALKSKTVSGEGFWLVKSRINDKETAINMILNIPLKYAINRLAFGRDRTKDEHKTAGKMQKSPSHSAGRWTYLVNPLQSSLGYKERGKKSCPKFQSIFTSWVNKL